MGATPRQQFWRITLPMLTPVIFFNLVVQTIEAFKAFTPAFIVSGGSGGPIDSTLFYTLYLYQEAFGYLRMGYAAALAWLLVLAIMAVTAAAFLTQRLCGALRMSKTWAVLRHCEARLRRSNPGPPRRPCRGPGLLRCARNDGEIRPT